MNTELIFLALAIYFISLGLYKSIKKDKSNILFPDNNINVLFRRIDKVNNISAYAAISLGFFILLIIIYFYINNIDFTEKINDAKINRLKIYNVSLLILIIGGVLNVSLIYSPTPILGDLYVLKKSIKYYYEIQNFKKIEDWIDYPEYSGDKKESYIEDIVIFTNVFYIISFSKILFYLGSFGICISVFIKIFSF